MDRSYERARLAGRIRRMSASICDVADALSDLGIYDTATKAYEFSIDLLHLERELLELPLKTGVPAPEQENPCPTADDIPF